jgi:uncharacterized protein (DUF305 family)
MIRKPYAIAAAITLIGISAAVASSDLSPGSQALQAANEGMHKAMAVEMTGDVDVDFVRGMIPHHQGAVDMAKIVLQYGKDPEIRKLAEQVVAAQETEIAFMNAWLEKNGAEAPAADGASQDGASQDGTDHSAH